MSQQISSNFDLYKVFMYVGKYKSLTKAAAELNVSQPAVSQSMKQLEANLGVKLTQRTGHGVKLTPEGEVIFPYIRKGCDAFSQAEKALEKLMGDAPKADISETDTAADKEADIRTVYDCFISGTQYSHFTGQKLPYRLLEHLPIILTRDDDTRRNLNAFLKSNNINLVPITECDSQEEVLKKVISNDGIGCVSYDCAQKAIESEDAYVLEFEKAIPERIEKIVKK